MIAANDSDQPGLPTLQDLRRKTQFTSRQVAEAARVPLRVEYAMEIGGIVTQENAKKVLAAFSHLTGTQYSLRDVQVHLTGNVTHFPDQQPRLAQPARFQSVSRKGHQVL
jgi:hypothetical protein